MYEDEALQNVKSGATNVYRIGKEVYSFVQKLKSSNAELVQEAAAKAQDFVFTGRPTDIIFFEENKSMSKSVLDSIADPKMKNAVLDNLVRAEKAGLIFVDLENGKISLTEKGQEYLKKPELIRQAQSDQAEALQNPYLVEKSFGVELDGSDRDLNFFMHGNELDLRSIAKNPDSETVGKIFENFAKLEEKGLISVTPDYMLRITKNGEELLSGKAFKLANGGLAEKAVAALPGAGKIIAVTKKILTETVKVAAPEAQRNGQVLGS